MTAVERISEIRGHVESLSGLVGRPSFAELLDAASPGGPRLELDDDPIAVAIMAGATPPHLVPAPVIAPDAGSPGPVDAPAPVDAPSGAAPPPGADWVSLLPTAGQEWSGEIDVAATANGVDPRLLAALVWSESGFRPDAVSSAGAIGLAQLMPGTADGLDVDPHDPVQNLDGGARYLRQMLDRYGDDPTLALAAYNAGPGRVDDAGGVPDIAETRSYVVVVLDRYRQLGGAA